MASTKEYLDFVLEQLSRLDEISSRAMMGEYILFKFPVFYNGQTIEEIRWDKENTVETVVQLSKGNIPREKVRMEFDLKDMDMSGFQQGLHTKRYRDWSRRSTDYMSLFEAEREEQNR